jgi:50S ribosomal subunit-associated GTPase HflX
MSLANHQSVQTQSRLRQQPSMQIDMTSRNLFRHSTNMLTVLAELKASTGATKLTIHTLNKIDLLAICALDLPCLVVSRNLLRTTNNVLNLHNVL